MQAKMDLLIASFRIRFEPAEKISLQPGKRFDSFLTAEEGEADVTISVSKSRFELPESAVKVFDAPLIEEENGRIVVSGKPFWCVWKESERIFVVVFPPGEKGEKVLVITEDSTHWDLFLDSTETTLDPLVYPLDGLILYYLTSMRGAVMIHASAVSYNGRGWLFSGRSGNGKTTIAKLFDSQGISVIHDDRVILVKKEGRWFIYSTPVYVNDVPRYAPLDHIWLIEHGKSNVSIPVEGAIATAMVLSNCIQQTWEGDAAERLLTTIEDLTTTTQVSRLLFVPDPDICNYLILRKEEERESVFAVALSLLREGRSVTSEASGISMWPVIKPGDNVVIEPYKEGVPARGDVVALIHQGGFVVHRIKKSISRDGRILYETQGDSASADEHLAEAYEIAGVVSTVIREGKPQPVRPRRMPVFVNRVLAILSSGFAFFQPSR